MVMTSRFLTSAAMLTAFCGVMPAVDPQLLSLAPGDAVAIADVNVLTAKASPFGKYVITQITANGGFTQATAAIGFDPRQDLNEVLVCSNGVPKTGLALASGTFNVGALTAAASQVGAASETYKGVTILEDPTHEHGFAFLGSSIAVAGDIAGVKGAIDRQGNAPALPGNVVTQINQLSTADDAWFLSTVPPATLEKKGTTLPGLPSNAAANVLQQIQSASGGVKFGSTIQFNAQAQTDTAQNATAMAGLLQLMVNMAQMQQQSGKNAEGLAALKNLTVTASGNSVNISLSLPEAQFQQLFAKPAVMKKAAVRR